VPNDGSFISYVTPSGSDIRESVMLTNFFFSVVFLSSYQIDSLVL
jgi:hypothetical protein